MKTKLWIPFAGLVLATTAESAEYVLPAEGDVIGTVEVIEARHEDTFVALARRYNVGFEALRQANPDVDFIFTSDVSMIGGGIFWKI